MSKLYDAISKIESKQSKKNDIPIFNKKSKPPYFLIIATVVFVVVLLFSAVVIKNRVANVEHKKIVNKKSIRVVSDSKKTEQKKQTVTGKAIKKQNLVVNLTTRHKNNAVKKAMKKSDNVKVKNRVVYNLNNVETLTLSKKKANNAEIKVVDTIKTDKNQDSKSENNVIAETKDSVINKLLNDIKSSDGDIAIAAYKKLIQRFPHKIELYNNLSVRYMNSSDYKDATKVLKEALKIKDDQDLKINLVIAYIKMHNYKMAKDVMRKVGEPKSKNIDVINNINDFLNSQ